MTDSSLSLGGRTGVRTGTAVVVATAAAALCAFLGRGSLAVVGAWIAGATVYLVWTWAVIGTMAPDRTREHATAEDPSRGASEAILLTASLGSLVGVAFLLLGASNTSGTGVLEAILGVAAVALSWLVVHTLYTVRYADLYYSGTPGGIDFNEGDGFEPAYGDFAYLAFTLGMTYQVSDTDLTTTSVRRTAIRHALVSYLLGAVVLAMTINLVVQLAGSGSGGH